MRFNEVIFSDLATKTGLDKIHIKNLPSVVALAGKNGAGKTRFLNCISSMIASKDIDYQRFTFFPEGSLSDLRSLVRDYVGDSSTRDQCFDYLKSKDFKSNDFIEDYAKHKIDNSKVSGIIIKSLKIFIKTINTDSIQELLMPNNNDADDKLLSQFNSDVKEFGDLLKYKIDNVDKSELQIIKRCGFNYILNLSNSVIQEDLRFRLDMGKAKESPANIFFARVNYFLDMFLHKKLEFNVEIIPKGKIFESNPQLLLAGRPFLHKELSLGEKILLTIALLFFVLDQNINFPLRECIILIDEPESHLHPDVQIRLIKGITTVRL